jgi:hypothetical protein
MLFLTIKTNFPLQVYYELDDHRSKVDASDVAICRVEQLCPFPYDLVQRELKRYPSTYYSFEDNQVCVILEVVKVFISKMSNDTFSFC